MPPSFRATGLAVACLAVVTHTALAQLVMVRGRVTDEKGHPVEGATVVARNPDASPGTLSTKSDRAGWYSFLGLRGGTWTFLAGARGFEVTQLRLRVSNLRATTLPDLRLLRVPPPPAGALDDVEAKSLLEALEAADADLDAGRADSAASKYRELLARAPALTSLHARIGQACRAQGDLACAAREYAAAIAADAAAEADRVDLGRVLLEQGNLEAARQVLSEAAARPAAEPDAWCALGAVELAAGQLAAAEAAFAKAAALAQLPVADACPRDRVPRPPSSGTSPLAPRFD